MASLNKAILIGRLTHDPQLTSMPNGDSACTMHMAVNRRVPQKDGSYTEEANYFTVKAYRRLAQICGQYLIKGGLIYVEGQMSAHAWISKKTNQPQAEIRIAADKILILDSKRDKSGIVDPNEPQRPVTAADFRPKNQPQPQQRRASNLTPPEMPMGNDQPPYEDDTPF